MSLIWIFFQRRNQTNQRRVFPAARLQVKYAFVLPSSPKTRLSQTRWHTVTICDTKCELKKKKQTVSPEHIWSWHQHLTGFFFFAWSPSECLCGFTPKSCKPGGLKALNDQFEHSETAGITWHNHSVCSSKINMLRGVFFFSFVFSSSWN